MSGFVKLDCRITESSLWLDRDARSLFVTALVLAEPYTLERPVDQIQVRELKPTGWTVPAGRYGFVRASGAALIERDGVEKENGWRALEALCAPDPDSRSSAHDGRRLARIEGGYLVLNHAAYRDRDYSGAERAQRYRNRKKAEAAVGASRDDRYEGVTQSDAYASDSDSAFVSDSGTAAENDSLHGERPHGAKVEDFLAAHDFGPFRDLIEGYIRASRSALAVMATFSMHLTGEMGHEKATPVQLGLALQQYVPQEENGRFKANYFAGFIRKAKAQPERTARRAANASEEARIIQERREAEQRAQEERDRDMVVAFKRHNEKKYRELRDQAAATVAANAVGSRMSAAVREVLIHDELVKLVRAKQ